MGIYEAATDPERPLIDGLPELRPDVIFMMPTVPVNDRPTIPGSGVTSQKKNRPSPLILTVAT